MTHPETLLELAVQVAAEAARLVADRRLGGVSVADTKSSPTDIVTETDRASESLIRSRLLGARPDDGFLGEEGGADAAHSGVRWIVDPIDGTVNFLYGLPAYSVSIAAEVDGEVEAGVVLDVASGATYTALRGSGARRDGVPLAVRGPAPMAERLLMTGFSYEPGRRTIQAAAVARLLPQVRDIRRFGSAALDLCHVAEGTADGYVEEGVNTWDYAAGGLIAREAGARTALLPGAGGSTLLVCGPEHGFDELLTVVRSCGFVLDEDAGPAQR